jgi:peroxiredoxin (alkyl hydroperoxide reductase subunit C)
VLVANHAPEFTCEAIVNNQIQKVSLTDYKGKWVVLFFYPLDFTFVCPTEITAFSDSVAEFTKHNCQILGASVDSVYSHLAWIKTSRKEGGLGGLHFPLLADLDKSLSMKYDVLLKDGKALRGLFIIDPSGTVQAAILQNTSVGRSVDEVLRLLQAYQYNAEHGEVCPANWKPGKATMKGNPEGSKEYFSKLS